MSLCIAYTDGETTWVGSDTRHSSGDWVFTGEFVKVASVGPWRVLFTGKSRLMDGFSRLKGVSEDSSCRDVLKELKGIWRDEYDLSPDMSDGNPNYRLEMIFARVGEVWEVRADLGPILVPIGTWCVIGSGQDVALGALEAAEEWSSPDICMDVAFQITRRHIPSVGGRLIVEKLSPLQPNQTDHSK